MRALTRDSDCNSVFTLHCILITTELLNTASGIVCARAGEGEGRKDGGKMADRCMSTAVGRDNV